MQTPNDSTSHKVEPVKVNRLDRHTVIVSGLLHESEQPLPETLLPSLSRWGHGGMYFWPGPRRASERYLYVFEEPVRLYLVDDFEMGSWHLLVGFGEDNDFNQILRELGPRAGLPDGPPWALPNLPQPYTVYGVDYFRELHRLLREHLEALGYDGTWIGGEMIVWNYQKLTRRRCIDTAQA